MTQVANKSLKKEHTLVKLSIKAIRMMEQTNFKKAAV